jgi:hypothetical protein
MKSENQIFEETLKELKNQFPGKTMLTINETAKAYGFEKSNGDPNPQSIYNGLRKNAVNPFPVKPVKRCGKWYWNIAHVAQDMAS